MLIRKTAIVAALAALGLLALSASASASTAIRTDPGGALLTGSTTLTNTSSTPFIYSMAGFGTITCSQVSFDADLSSRSGATNVAGSLTALTLTSCTDTIPVLTYTSCHLHGQAPTVSILANDNSGVFTFGDFRRGVRRGKHRLHDLVQQRGALGGRHFRLARLGVRSERLGQLDAQPHRPGRHEPHCDCDDYVTP
jgi:hypothetical protein